MAFEHEARNWAQGCMTGMQTRITDPPPHSHPFARAQAPLDLCVDLAKEWLEAHGGSVHALLGQGVIQLQSPEDPGRAEAALPELHRRLGALGGHCEHVSLEPDPGAPQAAWETELLRRLEGVR
jgi:hypothetical protein